MRRDFRQLTKFTLIYGSGTVASQLASTFLLPLYSRALTPADYGTLAVVALVVSILTPFLSMGLGNGLIRYYYEYQTEEERQRLVRSCLVPILAISFLIVAVMWWSAGVVTKLLFTSGDYAQYLRIGLITAFFTGGSMIPRYTLRVQQRAVWYVVNTVGQLLVTAAAGIYLVVILKQGVSGVLYAGLISAIVSFLVVNALVLGKAGIGPVSTKMIWRCWRFGIYLVPDALASWTINMADRWFIERYTSRTALGLYSLGHRFGEGVQILVVGPVESAVGPYVLSILKRPGFRVLYARILTYSMVIAVTVFLLVSLNGGNVVRLLTVPSYYGASAVIPLISLAYVLELANWTIGTGLAFAEKPKWFFVVTVLGAIVNLLLNWLLAPRYGMMGSAYATVLSYTSMCATNYVLAQAMYPIRYEYGRIFRIIAVALGLYTVGHLASVDNLVANLFLQTFLALAFLPALAATGFLTPDERGAVNRAWQAVKTHRPRASGRV